MLRTSSLSVRHDAVPKDVVVAAARHWRDELRSRRPEFVRLGYFGSYARGDYLPGSDFDVMIEVSQSDIPHWRDRSDSYSPKPFPVPLNLFVYTSDEIARLRHASDPFLSAIDREIRCID